MPRSLAFVATLWVASAPTIASATDYVDDPLTAPTFAGRGSRGGTFSTAGWTTSAEPDAVWYEIADAVPTGSIAYTVSGMSVGGTLSGYDHDLLTMYQAPTGSAEPISYNPYFRNNDFKAFTRIFGSSEPGRGGAMKLELALCSRGDPWYHDTACPAGCDGSGLAYARGTDKDVGWDPAHEYRMVLSWGSGTFTFSRDGEELGKVAYPGTYAPQPLRVRLGSPRHDGVYPGAAFMPKGLVFKDVKVTGTASVRTPVCGATSVDAGPIDTGVAPDASVMPGEVAVLQDVTAASWEPGVYSVVTDLNVEATSAGAPSGVVYLKFPPFVAPPKKVVLRMHTGDAPSSQGGSGEPCLTDDAWSETTLTWATKPAIGAACAGDARSVDADVDVDWDITSLVAAASAGNRNLAIVSHDANGAHYLSKEASATRGPRLLVVAGDPIPDAGTADSSASDATDAVSDAGSDALSIADTSTPADGSAPTNDLENGDVVAGGCGCEVPSTRSPRDMSELVLLLAAVALARRRSARGTAIGRLTRQLLATSCRASLSAKDGARTRTPYSGRRF